MLKSILYEYTPDELQYLLDTSNGYSDLLRKIGLNPKGGNPETLKKVIFEYKLDCTQLDINRRNLSRNSMIMLHKKKKIPIEEIIFNGKKTNTQSQNLLRELIKNHYKEYKCERCGINSWNNKDITLQLHHRDGDRSNNMYNNLEILCPNCHSQTETFSGRNRKKHKKIKIKKNRELKQLPVTKEELKNLIRTTPFTTIGKQYNVTDNAIRKWCDRYKLPRSSRLIKQISDEEWEKY